MNPWLLGLAIVAEVIGSASLRASEGFTRWLPSVLVVLTYAVWSGVGTALTAIIGWTFFRDAFHPTALGGIALIILGVVVLNLGGAGHE